LKERVWGKRTLRRKDSEAVMPWKGKKITLPGGACPQNSSSCWSIVHPTKARKNSNLPNLPRKEERYSKRKRGVLTSQGALEVPDPKEKAQVQSAPCAGEKKERTSKVLGTRRETEMIPPKKKRSKGRKRQDAARNNTAKYEKEDVTARERKGGKSR